MEDVDITKPLELQTIGFKETRPVYLRRFKPICVKDLIEVNEQMTRLMEQHINIHESGNPNYSILDYVNPNFKATPAFLASDPTWMNYFKQINEKRHKETDYQIENLVSITNHCWKYFRHKD